MRSYASGSGDGRGRARPLGRWALALLLALALISGHLSAPAAGADPAGAQIDGTVRKQMRDKPNQKIPVIIVRKTKSAALDAIRGNGGQVKRQLELGNAVAAEVPAGRLEALAREPGVLRIAYDAPMASTALGDPLSGADPQTVYQPPVAPPGPW